MNDRILPKVEEKDKQHILDLYNKVKRNRSLDELLFFKTIVWSCIMAQYENDRRGYKVWITPYDTFVRVEKGSYMDAPFRSIEAIDKEYSSYKERQDMYHYFDKNIRNNFGSLI